MAAGADKHGYLWISIDKVTDWLLLLQSPQLARLKTIQLNLNVF